MAKRLSVGYQLYSARDDFAKDMEGTLAALADMGYQGVEFAGFCGRSAKEVAHMLKKADLKAVGSHVSLAQIREDMHGVLAFHQELGCETVAVPYLSESDRPGGADFADALRTLYLFGRLCKKGGVALLYHNHDFELEAFSGQTGLDFMLGAIPEQLLKAEPDVCWLKYAGRDPVEFLQRYARRCPLVHLHDFVATPGAPILFKPVGMGSQNVPALVAAAKESRVKWLVVEQDESTERPPLEDARLSAKYLLEQAL